jgi:hypothetical protein
MNLFHVIKYSSMVVLIFEGDMDSIQDLMSTNLLTQCAPQSTPVETARQKGRSKVASSLDLSETAIHFL